MNNFRRDCPAPANLQGRTKAQMLEYLRSRVSRAAILPAAIITQEDWRGQETAVARSVMALLPVEAPLIVRSSRRDENQGVNSDAGAFLTIGAVKGEEPLVQAIEAVLESYGRADAKDEVLIQPMAENLIGSGVAATFDLRTLQPYWIIDLATGRDSAIVTAGKAGIRSFSLLDRSKAAFLGDACPVVALLEELEEIFPDHAIEIEFGLTKEAPILFQCRTTPIDSRRAAHGALVRHTVEAAAKVEQLLLESTDHFGAGALGIMPDWNPAEMIGVKPTPLAYDLYAYMITDRTWSAARREQGYTEVIGPLMVSVLGTPFIKIAASLTSLVPADVPSTVRKRVVSACVAQLERNPYWHDKIEFELIPTCHRAGGIQEAWLTESLTVEERMAYDRSLRMLTNDMIRPGGGFDRDFDRIVELEDLLKEIRSRPVEARPSFSTLLAHARTLGAPLFARVARAAFVATDITRDAARGTALEGSPLPVRTVVDDLIADYRADDFATFIRRHGHVRPGTYDVRTPSYEEAPELYFHGQKLPAMTTDHQEHTLRKILDSALAGAGYAFSTDDFISFAHRAIAAREHVKYLYAGFVSDALTQLVRRAGHHGLGRDLLAFATLGEATRLEALDDPLTGFGANLEARKAAWVRDHGLRVPSLLFSADDLFAYEDLQSKPNFITDARVVAPTALIERSRELNCQGCIVLAEQADPGFDWIFTRGVAGLVTAYGGLNSHMAVRCRQMRLPAAIGIGPVLFEKIRDARMLVIDCASQRLEICQ